jgi:hypothetical protein
MCGNHVITLYTVGLQLNVMKYAKEHGNKIAELQFGPHLTKKIIHEWRRQEEPLKNARKEQILFPKVH